ncbi:MAG: GuaB1 family IMP dehydrogenase-related protein [Planctomycetes bacterium]|nr:GuaB1 family IMP dehydrogenase-related protein [Planctomycetota bacterium]
MRFLHPERDEGLELSLDDVFIVPGSFEGGSRLGVDLTPHDFPGGSHPVVSANMNAVTGKRMAETMARLGGLGVLPQDMDPRTVERIVGHIKDAHPRIDTALVVTPAATLRDVQGIIRKRSHDMVVVADDGGRLVGVITQADLRERDQYTPADRLVSRTLVTLTPELTNREVFELLDRSHVKAAPVVDAERRVLGVITRDDAVRLELLRPALDDRGRLMVAAALGIASDVGERARRLLDHGVDALVLDTAHGFQRRMVEAVRAVREVIGRARPLIAGNVCTVEGTRALIEAGADVVKVNIGPGAMCTTRMQTGVGRPTFSSVLDCAREARRHGKQVWADGGVRYPRDVALYLAAGAARVMVGTLLAGTNESPGDIHDDRDGRRYKVNYGMASGRAVEDRAGELDGFERAKRGFFREGISSSKVYLQDGRESVGALLVEIITGLQSACTYVGARDLRAFQEQAVVGVQTLGGFLEGKPRGLVND